MAYPGLGDISGDGNINQVDVTKIGLVASGGDYGFTTGIRAVSGAEIAGGTGDPDAFLIKKENSYLDTYGDGDYRGATKTPTNRYEDKLFSFAKDGYVFDRGDIAKGGQLQSWPNQVDVSALVDVAKVAASDQPNKLQEKYTDGSNNYMSIHPTNPKNITTSGNIVKIQFRRTLKTHDDDATPVSLLDTKYDTQNVYGGVRKADFQLYAAATLLATPSGAMISSYGNPTKIEFSTTDSNVPNDTLELTFDTLPTNANDKYWLTFIPRRDSDNLGISLTFKNFIWNSALSLIQAGVFIYGFTQGRTNGLTLTTGPAAPTITSSTTNIRVGEDIVIEIQNYSDYASGTGFRFYKGVVDVTNEFAANTGMPTQFIRGAGDADISNPLQITVKANVGGVLSSPSNSINITVFKNPTLSDNVNIIIEANQTYTFNPNNFIVTPSKANYQQNYSVTIKKYYLKLIDVPNLNNNPAPLNFTHGEGQVVPITTLTTLTDDFSKYYFDILYMLSYKPTNDSVIQFKVGYSIDDGDANTVIHDNDPIIFSSATYNLTFSPPVTNTVPAFTSVAVITGEVGVNYEYTITATDSDAGDTVTITAPTKPDWLTLISNTLSGTPPLSAATGNNSVTLRATDNNGGTKEQTFTINITKPKTGSVPQLQGTISIAVNAPLILTITNGGLYPIETTFTFYKENIPIREITIETTPQENEIFEIFDSANISNSGNYKVKATKPGFTPSDFSNTAIVTVSALTKLATPILLKPGWFYTNYHEGYDEGGYLGSGEGDDTPFELLVKNGPTSEMNPYPTGTTFTFYKNNLTRKDITVKVTDVDEDVPIITPTTTEFSIAEGNTAVQTFAESGNRSVSWSVVGTDAYLFQIDNTGALSFQFAPDFEQLTEAEKSNGFSITVVAEMLLSGGHGVETQKVITVKVTDVDENVPIITPTTTEFSIAEHKTAVQTFAESGNRHVSWSVVGTDAYLFQINRNTGALSFKTAPDFEALTADKKSNGFSITVVAEMLLSGGHFSETQKVITVKVTDVDENVPIITPTTTEFSIAEGKTAVQTFAESYNKSVSWSLDGTTTRYLQIENGALSFQTAQDFENLPWGRSDGFDVTVVAAFTDQDTKVEKAGVNWEGVLTDIWGRYNLVFDFGVFGNYPASQSDSGVYKVKAEHLDFASSDFSNEVMIVILPRKLPTPILATPNPIMEGDAAILTISNFNTFIDASGNDLVGEWEFWKKKTTPAGVNVDAPLALAADQGSGSFIIIDDELDLTSGSENDIYVVAKPAVPTDFYKSDDSDIVKIIVSLPHPIFTIRKHNGNYMISVLFNGTFTSGDLFINNENQTASTTSQVTGFKGETTILTMNDRMSFPARPWTDTLLPGDSTYIHIYTVEYSGPPGARRGRAEDEWPGLWAIPENIKLVKIIEEDFSIEFLFPLDWTQPAFDAPDNLDDALEVSFWEDMGDYDDTYRTDLFGKVTFNSSVLSIRLVDASGNTYIYAPPPQSSSSSPDSIEHDLTFIMIPEITVDDIPVGDEIIINVSNFDNLGNNMYNFYIKNKATNEVVVEYGFADVSPPIGGRRINFNKDKYFTGPKTQLGQQQFEIKARVLKYKRAILTFTDNIGLPINDGSVTQAGGAAGTIVSYDSTNYKLNIITTSGVFITGVATTIYMRVPVVEVEGLNQFRDKDVTVDGYKVIGVEAPAVYSGYSNTVTASVGVTPMINAEFTHYEISDVGISEKLPDERGGNIIIHINNYDENAFYKVFTDAGIIKTWWQSQSGFGEETTDISRNHITHTAGATYATFNLTLNKNEQLDLENQKWVQAEGISVAFQVKSTKDFGDTTWSSAWSPESYIGIALVNRPDVTLSSTLDSTTDTTLLNATAIYISNYDANTTYEYYKVITNGDNQKITPTATYFFLHIESGASNRKHIIIDINSANSSHNGRYYVKATKNGGYKHSDEFEINVTPPPPPVINNLTTGVIYNTIRISAYTSGASKYTYGYNDVNGFDEVADGEGGDIGNASGDGYDYTSYDHSSYDYTSYDYSSYDNTSYDYSSYDNTSYDYSSYDNTSYDYSSYDNTSYDYSSYDNTSYDYSSYDNTSYDYSSYDNTSYDYSSGNSGNATSSAKGYRGMIYDAENHEYKESSNGASAEDMNDHKAEERPHIFLLPPDEWWINVRMHHTEKVLSTDLTTWEKYDFLNIAQNIFGTLSATANLQPGSNYNYSMSIEGDGWNSLSNSSGTMKIGNIKIWCAVDKIHVNEYEALKGDHTSDRETGQRYTNGPWINYDEEGDSGYGPGTLETDTITNDVATLGGAYGLVLMVGKREDYNITEQDDGSHYIFSDTGPNDYFTNNYAQNTKGTGLDKFQLLGSAFEVSHTSYEGGEKRHWYGILPQGYIQTNTGVYGSGIDPEFGVDATVVNDGTINANDAGHHRTPGYHEGDDYTSSMDYSGPFPILNYIFGQSQMHNWFDPDRLEDAPEWVDSAYTKIVFIPNDSDSSPV